MFWDKSLIREHLVVREFRGYIPHRTMTQFIRNVCISSWISQSEIIRSQDDQMTWRLYRIHHRPSQSACGSGLLQRSPYGRCPHCVPHPWTTMYIVRTPTINTRRSGPTEAPNTPCISWIWHHKNGKRVGFDCLQNA